MLRHQYALAALFSIALTQAALAQIPLGSAAIMTTDSSGATISSMNLTTGVSTSISPMAASLAAAASCLEIDPLTGNLLVGSHPTTGGSEAEIHRLVLNGFNVRSARRALTLPGSSGQVFGMERQPNGAIIVLCHSPSGSPLFFRLVITPDGEAATQIPISAPSGTFWSLATDAAGNILTCNFPFGAGSSSIIYGVGPAGGVLTPTGQSVPFAAGDIELDAAGSGLHAGGLPTTLGGPNYFCGGAPFTYGPTNPPYSDVVQEIAQESGGNILVATHAGGIGGTLWRMAGCAPPGTQVATFPAGVSVAKIVPARRSLNYGAPCHTSQGNIAFISQMGFPQPGGTWKLKLTGALPYTGARVVFGPGSSAPVAIPGAPGCFYLNAATQTFVTITDGFGNANLTIPLSSIFSGASIHAQWEFDDAALNSAGLCTTAGLAALL